LIFTGPTPQQLLAIGLTGKVLIDNNLLHYSLEHHLGHEDISPYVKVRE
jgi:hypothetical protein